MVSSLLPFFIADRSVTNTVWIVVKDEFNIELDFLKRKVYRYRTLIRKKNIDGLLGLGKMEESANNANTSNINKYV